MLAARIGDMHVCPMVTGIVPHVGGPLTVGAPTVLTCCIPQATVTKAMTCVGPPDLVTKGSGMVMVCNMPAARLGDLGAHGGAIVAGAPTVLIGG